MIYRKDLMCMTPLQEMISVFEDAKEFNTQYIAVKIQMDGFEKPEVIINEKENINSKLEYYMNTYDENLIHKHSPGIKIVYYTYGNSFEDIYNTI